MLTTRTNLIALALTLACGLATSAMAGNPITGATAVITADNHYALYTGTTSSVTFVGGNELGSAGNPGTYNWSRAETHNFNPDAFIYIAAWSDDAVAQGLLAKITLAAGGTLHSGSPLWQVYPTFQNMGDNAAFPTALSIQNHLATADAGNLWQTPFVGSNNGVSPWGTISGIDANIPWMWVNIPSRTNPLTQTGDGYGEVLIFRTVVPAPGPAALIGMGGLLIAKRRRR